MDGADGSHPGLPEGRRVWFFHPLAFIRNFRGFSWLTLQEQAQLLPHISTTTAGGTIYWSESKLRLKEGSTGPTGRAPSILVERSITFS